MSRQEKTELREKILETCKSILEARIKASEKAMADAQESANSEEKSSAGDKYETSRAMGHRDRNMIGRQMMEAKRELNLLNTVNSEQEIKLVSHGAVVIAGTAIYFIGVGLGKIKQDDLDFIALSLASPLGQALKGKKAGDEVVFNGNKIKIKEVF